METIDLSRRRKVLFTMGVIGLCSLQLLELSAISIGPRRQPYSSIAAALRTRSRTARPVYTTWPWGIGETVNFYLNGEVVQPFPSQAVVQRSLPREFVLLYRPAVQKEEDQVTTLLRKLSNARKQCQYYASPTEKDFGTRLCIIDWNPTRNRSGALPPKSVPGLTRVSGYTRSFSFRSSDTH